MYNMSTQGYINTCYTSVTFTKKSCSAARDATRLHVRARARRPAHWRLTEATARRTARRGSTAHARRHATVQTIVYPAFGPAGPSRQQTVLQSVVAAAWLPRNSGWPPSQKPSTATMPHPHADAAQLQGSLVNRQASGKCVCVPRNQSRKDKQNNKLRCAPASR